MKLNEIKPNPDNPRVLHDAKFLKLKESLKHFPEMMEKRPIVVDENRVILGGNMRFKALQAIYGKNGEIPDSWVTVATGWTDEQKREFVIKDNASFGEWDLDALTTGWNIDDLINWGVDIEPKKQEEEKEPETKEVRPYVRNHILISYKLDQHEDVINTIAPLFDIEGVEVEQSAN